MENNIFNIKRYTDKTVLKLGRKIYATITENKNPDFKFILWLQNGIALSGYETEQKAIERAVKMRNDFTDMATEIYNQIKNIK